jgi:hypothetical protein
MTNAKQREEGETHPFPSCISTAILTSSPASPFRSSLALSRSEELLTETWQSAWGGPSDETHLERRRRDDAVSQLAQLAAEGVAVVLGRREPENAFRRADLGEKLENQPSIKK